MKKRTMEEWFATIPELPEGFYEWCLSFLPKIPIYYRRVGKEAECQCGKCGMHFVVKGKPSRNESAECPFCENKGFYEWKKIKHGNWHNEYLFLLQKTTDNNLVCRIFESYESYRQGVVATIYVKERKRVFLTIGDVYWFNQDYWRGDWAEKKGHDPIQDGTMYEGWEEEIENSNFKYCDVENIWKMTHRPKLNILMAYANNPAIEMYVKSGMEKLVDFLIWKEAKTKWINRRGKNISQQFRLKDKRKIKRFIESKGDIKLLEILQVEEKNQVNYTVEQEEFLRKMFDGYYNRRKAVEYLLKFMSLQQLMNRVEKYRHQFGYYSDYEVVGRYYDYLQMREELGYDMTNEVYLHPRDLKETHDEMVAERKARQDEKYITDKMQQYPDIAKKYKKLNRKYRFSSEGYVIRPAKDAKEIIMEGRILHHCVGGDGYLRKHNKGETTILFLRKAENKDEPYYTIEINKNEIIQWYGLRDKKPDREIIEPWLEEYVKHLNGQRLKETTQQLLQEAV